MKDLIQYHYKTVELFFKYLNEGIGLNAMIDELREMEDHAREFDTEGHGIDAGMWFRIPSSNTLATTIDNLSVDLMPGDPDKEFTEECMRAAVDDMDLLVYFS